MRYDIGAGEQRRDLQQRRHPRRRAAGRRACRAATAVASSAIPAVCWSIAATAWKRSGSSATATRCRRRPASRSMSDGDGRYDRGARHAAGRRDDAAARARRVACLAGAARYAHRPARSTIGAQAVTGSGTPGTVFAGAGDGGGDAVVGPTGARAELVVPVGRRRDAPTLTKTQSVLAPDGSARAVRGAMITYTLVARFPAATGAARIDDPVPAGTTYVPGSLSLDGAADAATAMPARPADAIARRARRRRPPRHPHRPVQGPHPMRRLVRCSRPDSPPLLLRRRRRARARRPADARQRRPRREARRRRRRHHAHRTGQGRPRRPRRPGRVRARLSQHRQHAARQRRARQSGAQGHRCIAAPPPARPRPSCRSTARISGRWPRCACPPSAAARAPPVPTMSPPSGGALTSPIAAGARANSPSRPSSNEFSPRPTNSSKGVNDHDCNRDTTPPAGRNGSRRRASVPPAPRRRRAPSPARRSATRRTPATPSTAPRATAKSNIATFVVDRKVNLTSSPSPTSTRSSISARPNAVTDVPRDQQHQRHAGFAAQHRPEPRDRRHRHGQFRRRQRAYLSRYQR